MSKILTLDEIKAVSDVTRETIEVPEWGGAVVVQGVSLADGMTLLKQMQNDKGEVDPEKAALYAVLVGVVEPKFGEADLVWLRDKSMSALTKITQAFMRLSGFEATVKEARKNS